MIQGCECLLINNRKRRFLSYCNAYFDSRLQYKVPQIILLPDWNHKNLPFMIATWPAT